MLDEASSEPDTALTEKILQLIGIHHQALETAPAPASLRDTLLAVAALLHLEAAKSGTGPGHTKTKVKHLEKAFASAARERLRAAIQASGHIVVAGNARLKH
jgi:hypothetical protein